MRRHRSRRAKAQDAWIKGTGAVVAASAAVLVLPLDEFGVRVVGMVLQVGGTAVVAFEIAEAHARFGVKGPIEAVRDWLKTRPRNVIIGRACRPVPQRSPERSPWACAASPWPRS